MEPRLDTLSHAPSNQIALIMTAYSRTPIVYHLFSLLTLFIASDRATGQTFTGTGGSGFGAFKQLIEFESQRFLMTEVYQVSASQFDQLVVEKTIQEIDETEGFMFVMTCYRFNGNTGVVLTAFNSRNLVNTAYGFRNVHLTSEQFQSLNALVAQGMTLQQAKEKIHHLKKFDDRLTVDLNVIDVGVYVTLWVDGISRHTFSDEKWARANKRFVQFAAEK